MKGGYVDGFVFPVTKKNVAEYKKMAAWGAKTWMKFGALAYFECMGEDLTIKPMGGIKQRSFKDLAKAGPNDTVWFSFIVYKNKKHRDAVNKKVMAYFDKKYTEKEQRNNMPFDMKRMSYAGFTVVVG